MAKLAVLYVTYPSMKAARAAAALAIKKRLAACVNIARSTALYTWKGRNVEAKECIAIFKTTGAKEKALRHEIEAGHPFDVPCVLRLDAAPNKAYFGWVEAQTR